MQYDNWSSDEVVVIPVRQMRQWAHARLDIRGNRTGSGNDCNDCIIRCERPKILHFPALWWLALSAAAAAIAVQSIGAIIEEFARFAVATDLELLAQLTARVDQDVPDDRLASLAPAIGRESEVSMLKDADATKRGSGLRRNIAVTMKTARRE